MARQKYCCQDPKIFCIKCACKICDDLLPFCKCVQAIEFKDFEYGWVDED